jgi:hypothetical protein
MGLLTKMDGLTLLGVGEKAPASVDWQAIFWCCEAVQEDVEPVVQGRMGAAGVTGLRSVLKELRGSQVGLVWSSKDEKDKHGALYWYDPSDGVDLATTIDPQEAAAVLKEVAAFLTK